MLSGYLTRWTLKLITSCHGNSFVINTDITTLNTVNLHTMLSLILDSTSSRDSLEIYFHVKGGLGFLYLFCVRRLVRLLLGYGDPILPETTAALRHG